LASQTKYLPVGSTPSIGGAFVPNDFVNEIWDDRVVPAAKDQSVAVEELLAALQQDAEAAQAQYGHVSSSGSFSYLIRGSGRATLDESGLLVISDPSLPAGTTLSLVTSASTGTSLRDSLGFISVNDFETQIDYANVATALNDRALAEAFPDGPEPFDGIAVNFVGAVTIIVPLALSVVPVEVAAQCVKLRRAGAQSLWSS
jgi:predicted lipoprotein